MHHNQAEFQVGQDMSAEQNFKLRRMLEHRLKFQQLAIAFDSMSCHFGRS